MKNLYRPTKFLSFPYHTPFRFQFDPPDTWVYERIKTTTTRPLDFNTQFIRSVVDFKQTKKGDEQRVIGLRDEYVIKVELPMQQSETYRVVFMKEGLRHTHFFITESAEQAIALVKQKFGADIQVVLVDTLPK